MKLKQAKFILSYFYGKINKNFERVITVKEEKYMRLSRTFGPLYNEDSEILILGSFPSVKSREVEFFYGHPQNRFWKVISTIYGCDLPQSIDEKKDFALKNHIALWDTIDSCDIIGSDDSSIKNIVPTDINLILSSADIKAVFCNGAVSHKLYMKHSYPLTGVSAVKLPSTSPANAAYSLDRLVSIWKEEISKFIILPQ